MPLLNSTGALKQLNMYLTPISSQQWIAQFNTFGSNKTQPTVTNKGVVYLVNPDNLGIIKVNPNGTKGFAYNTYDTGTTGVISCMDTSNNVYIGGYDSGTPSVGAVVIKFNPNGGIVWQKYYLSGVSNVEVISMVIAPTGDLFVLTASLAGGSPLGGAIYVLFRINSSTGAIINQRKLLKQASSAPTDLTIDRTNSNLIVSGTDYSTTNSTILIGLYNFTNTDTASNMLIQSSTSDPYNVNAYGNNERNVVTDGTYIYMLGYRVISGITRSVYMKIDRSTGAVSYSNDISIGATSYELLSITMDNSGYIYILGDAGGTTPLATITKVRCSDGAIMWCRTFGSTSSFENISSIIWSRGFLYFVVSIYVNPGTGLTYIYGLVKMNSDGSLPDGTYGTYWYFGTGAATTTAYNPQSTGTTTGSNSTTTYTSANSTYTMSSDPVTISTINIP